MSALTVRSAMNDLGTVVHVALDVNNLRYGGSMVGTKTRFVCCAIVNVGEWWLHRSYDGTMEVFAKSDQIENFPFHTPQECLS